MQKIVGRTRNSPHASSSKPHPNIETSSQPSPRGKKQHPNILKHSRNELPPLGEGMGRGFWGVVGAFAFYLPALSIISLICWEK